MTNTTRIGQDAENVASKYLGNQGLKIIDRNWRTKYCEIDIIAAKNAVVYFIEVKYRQNDAHGDGLDAINSKKLRQMTFAAEYWVTKQQWAGDYQLAVVSVNDQPPKVSRFIVI